MGVAVVAVIASMTLVPAPAYAGTCTFGLCGTIYHDTNGLSAAMTIRCNFGDPNTNRTLLPGNSSSSKCLDTDQVRVDDGFEIWCWDPYAGYSKHFDATGWHKIYDHANLRCHLRRD